MICIAMLPVKMAEPKMKVGKIGLNCCNGEIFCESFVVLFATDIKLAEHLMHMIGVRGNREQEPKLRPGDLTPRQSQIVTRSEVARMSLQPTKKRGFGVFEAVLVKVK